MRRDMHSKAIVFPPDPHKQAIKDQRKKAAHQGDEIQFLADCINYQQKLIEEQSKTIADLTGSEISGTTGTAKKTKTSKQ